MTDTPGPPEEQEPHRLGLVYTPDIVETDSGPIDEGKLRAFLEQVLIPNASPTAQEILKTHPGLEFSKRPNGSFEVTTSYAGVFVGGFEQSVFRP